VLISGASLLLESFRNIEAVPLGMRSEHVITTDISLGQSSYPSAAKRLAFFEKLESRLQGMPGADAVAISDTIPPSGAMHAEPYNALEVAGQQQRSNEAGGMVAWREITPGYFSALRIPILRGRGFEETDRSSTGELAILSQTLARRLFGNSDALGARIRFHGGGSPWATVIGVVGNVKNGGVLEQDDPEYYVVRKHLAVNASVEQGTPEFGSRGSVVIRTSLATAMISNWIRQQVAAVDPTLPLKIETMDERVEKLEARPRFNAWLLTIFAAIGLLLSAIGLYGLVSFLVVRQTQEIGVRLALGATPGEIARMVLSRAARWSGAGILLGLAISIAAGRVIQSMLYGISGQDALALTVPVLILASTALLAAWIPSRKAARIDPVEALRRE
jgi:predicted permease